MVEGSMQILCKRTSVPGVHEILRGLLFNCSPECARLHLVQGNEFMFSGSELRNLTSNQTWIRFIIILHLQDFALCVLLLSVLLLLVVSIGKRCYL